MENMQQMMLNLYSNLGVPPPDNLHLMRLPSPSPSPTLQTNKSLSSVDSPVKQTNKTSNHQGKVKSYVTPSVSKKLVMRDEVEIDRKTKSCPMDEDPEPIRDFDYHLQDGSTVCGYYMMTYMKEIPEMGRDDIDFTLRFTEVREAYTKLELDGVRDRWVQYLTVKEFDRLSS